MTIEAKRFQSAALALCGFCAWLIVFSSNLWSQTYDFGYVPLGTTNKASGFNFVGNSYNGTNLFMASESMIGPNAGDFLTSTNYAGQELPPGHFYFYSLSFVPTAFGFETAVLSTLETPKPPFGAGIIYLQAVGAPTNRPGTGPVVAELAPPRTSDDQFPQCTRL